MSPLDLDLFTANPVCKAVDYVSRSSGIERTRSLARVYAQKARDILRILPESDTRHGLEALTTLVVA